MRLMNFFLKRIFDFENKYLQGLIPQTVLVGARGNGRSGILDNIPLGSDNIARSLST